MEVFKLSQFQDLYRAKMENETISTQILFLLSTLQYWLDYH